LSRRCGPHCQAPETRACTTSATTRLSSPGLTGRSSTPRLLGWTRPFLEYWVARSSRAMTAVFVSSTGVVPAVGTERTRNDESRVSIQISNSRYTSTFSRRKTPEVCVSCPSNWREQGMPDARCTRGLACKRQKENAHEHTGSAEALRHSLRNGFTAYFELSPENRALLSPSPYGIWHPRPVGLAYPRKT
jgi:hypothetical protein